VSLREGAGDVVGVCPASLDAPVPHAAEAIAKRASRASSAYFMDEKTALQLSRLQSNVAAGVCGRSSYHATKWIMAAMGLGEVMASRDSA
jgi:hypothetical protein